MAVGQRRHHQTAVDVVAIPDLRLRTRYPRNFSPALQHDRALRLWARCRTSIGPNGVSAFLLGRGRRGRHRGWFDAHVDGRGGGTIGASGAVIACAILFACFFPHRELLLMLVLPVKAWVLAVIFVLADMAGAFGLLGAGGTGSSTAFTVHLAGAFFALGYYFLGWNFRKLDFLSLGELPQRLRPTFAADAVEDS